MRAHARTLTHTHHWHVRLISIIFKVRTKLALCMQLRHMGTVKSIAPCLVNLGTRRTQAITFTPRLLCSQSQPRVAVNRKLDGYNICNITDTRWNVDTNKVLNNETHRCENILVLLPDVVWNCGNSTTLQLMWEHCIIKWRTTQRDAQIK